MQFAYLGSGSRGNAALIESGDTCLLLDCGFSLRETVVRLKRLQREGRDLTAILLTHEHTDHVSGVGVVARRFNLPVWMTPGTWGAVEARIGSLPQVNLIDLQQTFEIDAVEVRPFPVPHDAREPVQFVFSDGDKRLGVLTDAGSSTAHIESVLGGCDSLALECNHERDMLIRGPYPAPLKTRIGGSLGHLDNRTAEEILSRLDTSRLQHLVAVHLSETNNTSTLARQALSNAFGCEPDIVQVADQNQGLSWHAIS